MTDTPMPLLPSWSGSEPRERSDYKNLPLLQPSHNPALAESEERLREMVQTKLDEAQGRPSVHEQYTESDLRSLSPADRDFLVWRGVVPHNEALEATLGNYFDRLKARRERVEELEARRRKNDPEALMNSMDSVEFSEADL